MHVVHLIGTLERGGAELFLERLCGGLTRLEPSWTQEVWTLGGRGSLAAGIEASAVPVRAFGVTKAPSAPWRGLQLLRELRRSRASVLQTWMYHADAVGIASNYLGLRIPQVWTLRQSNLSRDVNRRETLAIIRACAWASSRVPAVIVSGSHAALAAHRAIGYAAARMPVVHNGVDADRFAPDEGTRADVRQQWGVDDDTVTLGYLARVSPVKAHDVLLAAAALLKQRAASLPAWRLVLVGHGASLDDSGFATDVARHGLTGHVITPGTQPQPERVLPAFDVAVSSSLGEGFPNALAEAMACAVPVVATDVGDTRELVGDTGRLVPAGDPSALADALAATLRDGPEARRANGLASRARVIEKFLETDAIRAYAEIYRSVAR